MKYTMKELWFKISILIILIFFIYLVYSYFQQQTLLKREELLASLNAACQRSALAEKESFKSYSENGLFRSYEYAYNDQLKSCFVASVYTPIFDRNTLLDALYQNKSWEMVIQNLTTGEILFKEYPERGNRTLETGEEFGNMKKKYLLH